MKEISRKSVFVERRIALEKRRRVAEMSREEIERELLTSAVTGLPNRRAFEEAPKAVAVAISDLDGLKALNKYGYDVGNAALRAKADALRDAGLDAYHDKGDEFLCRGADRRQLALMLEAARAMLRQRVITVEKADGTLLGVKGVDFSYGVGPDLEQAEGGLSTHKIQRECAGALARGQLAAITVITHKPKLLNQKPKRDSAGSEKVPETRH